MKHIAEQYEMPIEYKGPETVGRAYSTERPLEELTKHLKVVRSNQPHVTAEEARAQAAKVSRAGSDERTHHRHGMSVLNYIAACPGFTSRGGTNEAAEEGQKLHDRMEAIAALAIASPEYNSGHAAQDALQKVLSDGPIGEEEELHLKFCCKELDFWLQRCKKGHEAFIERRVAIRNPDGSQLNYGHYDLLVFLSDTMAVLIDYKFGWIPVPPADQNWQGKGYAVGVFQDFPQLKKIGVVFIQPKLLKTTRHSYDCSELRRMYEEIRDVIRAAQAESKTLRPGPYCDYCAVAGTCTALLNPAAQAVAIHEGLPMPPTFQGLQINTPEDAARALYVLDRLEVLIRESGLKEKARELARGNGGQLKCALPDGREIVVDLKQRNSPRSANSPALIADALKDVLTPEQVLAACDPKITRLEDIFAEVMTEKGEADATAILKFAESEAERVTKLGAPPAEAEQIRRTAKQEAKAARITKKRAVEILSDTLTSEGLLSAPEGKVEYLKVRVEKPVKQIHQNGCNSDNKKTGSEDETPRN